MLCRKRKLKSEIEEGEDVGEGVVGEEGMDVDAVDAGVDNETLQRPVKRPKRWEKIGAFDDGS